MKRERPPMPPLSVRVKVAERQLVDNGDQAQRRWYADSVRKQSLAFRIRWIASCIFRDKPFALDHDPALILRDYDATVSDVADRYTPHAHDPNHLIYREKADHQQKTTGRKPGAERTVTTKGSDVGLAAKFRRLENPNPRRKAKIPSRPFQKRVK